MAYDLHGLARQVSDLIVRKRGITLTELSQRLGVDRHTVEKAILVAAGTTFRNFRRKLLFDEAVTLLRAEPNLPVKEVAFKLAFTSPRSFARFIKGASGKTPTELRNSD